MKRWWLLVFFIGAMSSCYVFKAYKYRKFELKDVEKIDAVQLAPSPHPFFFTYDTARYTQLRQYLDTNLAQSRSYAFLVMRNDTILYERYFGTVTQSSKLPSFSVAKSVVGTLVGIALHEGYIKSLQEPVTHYLPELRKTDKGYDRVTIQHVLDMRSGVKSSENYTNPFSNVLKMGFSSNVSKPALKTTLEKTPGEFEYKSVNTQLLALIIEKATGKKLQDYAMEKLWQPLGMEHPATWNDDKHNTVRAFCCINAAARDYAKFGLLYLKKGNWQNKQLVPEEWIDNTVNIDTMHVNEGYKNQWWSEINRTVFDDQDKAAAYARNHKYAQVKTYHSKDNNKTSYQVQYRSGAYHAEGLLGQFVYVYPEKNLVIVRLGYNWSHPKMYASNFIYNLGESL